jgi:hypothetical protein
VLRQGRWPRSFAGRAVAIHLLARAASLGAVVLAVAVHPLHTGSLGGDLGAALGKSDGVWYLGIAHHGYGPPPPIGPGGAYTHLTSLAFFPLYPILIRAAAVTGLPYLGAALVVTGIAGCVAAVAITAWARRLAGAPAALGLLVVWELLPSSIVLSMAYSEALFAAAAGCCLLALQRRRWLAAGLAAGIGGLARPTGACLLVAVAVAMFIEVRRGSRAVEWPRIIAAGVLAVAGLATSLIHVAVVTHRWDGWFWLERTVWRSGFDGGRSALDGLGQIVTGGRAVHRLPEIIAGVAIVVALALAVWNLRSRRTRPDAPAGWYAVAVAVLAVGERGYFYVKPRLLFLGFPALLPVGNWLASRRRNLTASLLAVLAVAASLAYNAYLLAGWPKAL